MTQFLIDSIPWFLSAVTILTQWMLGNRDDKAWIISLCSQPLWFLWSVLSHSYGFLPLNLFLTVIYFRNYLKWKKDRGA
jgi:hypothetical protein